MGASVPESVVADYRMSGGRCVPGPQPCKSDMAVQFCTVRDMLPLTGDFEATPHNGHNLMETLDYELLKIKRNRLKEKFPDSFDLRIHRAISWIGRAEQESKDPDSAFIHYWIAFNAAYARDDQDNWANEERSRFADYFEQIIRLDKQRHIYDAIWERFPGSIRLLFDNQYVFQPFWKFHNNVPGNDNWAERFGQSKRKVANSLKTQDTQAILSVLFDRLYVLRNQLIHGGATWNSGTNRSQVRDGAKIVAFLVPIFVDVMMDHPGENWGPPYYPRVS